MLSLIDAMLLYEQVCDDIAYTAIAAAAAAAVIACNSMS
jgi:hypothetical protein